MNEQIMKAGLFLGKGILQLVKIGTWGVLNQYTHQQFKDSSSNFIGEIERGTKNQAVKLKLIKND